MCDCLNGRHCCLSSSSYLPHFSIISGLSGRLHIGMSIACNWPVNDDCRPSAADAIVGESAGKLRAALGTFGAVVVTPSGNRRTHSWLPTVALGLSGSE